MSRLKYRKQMQGKTTWHPWWICLRTLLERQQVKIKRSWMNILIWEADLIVQELYIAVLTYREIKQRAVFSVRCWQSWVNIRLVVWSSWREKAPFHQKNLALEKSQLLFSFKSLFMIDQRMQLLFPWLISCIRLMQEPVCKVRLESVTDESSFT